VKQKGEENVRRQTDTDRKNIEFTWQGKRNAFVFEHEKTREVPWRDRSLKRSEETWQGRERG